MKEEEKMKKIISFTILTLTLCMLMYVPAFANVNILANGELDVCLNGEKISFEDTNAQIVNGKAYIPLRAVFEKLGANVIWIEDTATIIASAGENKLIVQIGNNSAFLNNDDVVELETAPYIQNNRTLISAEILKNIFDVDVEFGESLNIINK